VHVCVLRSECSYVYEYLYLYCVSKKIPFEFSVAYARRQILQPKFKT
jgi:hypothetical protein